MSLHLYFLYWWLRFPTAFSAVRDNRIRSTNPMIPATDLIIFIVWAVFLAWWWIPAFIHRTPLKKAPSRLSFFTRIAAIPVAGVIAAILFFAPWLAVVRVLPDTPVVVVTGFIVFIAGLAFAVWARLHLGSNWSGRPAIRENHTLTCTGPYSLVRNPIYTGFLAGILGTAIATGSFIAFFCLVLVFLMFLVKIRMEEEILSEEFGTEYEKYRCGTKSLVPWLL